MPDISIINFFEKKNGETGGREKRELLDMCLTLIVDKLGGEDARRNSGNENVELGRSRPLDQEDLWAQEISDKFRFHKKMMMKINNHFRSPIFDRKHEFQASFEF